MRRGGMHGMRHCACAASQGQPEEAAGGKGRHGWQWRLVHVMLQEQHLGQSAGLSQAEAYPSTMRSGFCPKISICRLCPSEVR